MLRGNIMANTFKENHLIHIPVTITPEDIKYKYRGKEGSWWSHNPLMKYDAMLISAAHGMSQGGGWEYDKEAKMMRTIPGIKGVWNRDEIRDDVLFFGDSGGFQKLQAYLDNLKDKRVVDKLTPEAVLNWQMDVCDIGMTLDMPTPRTWNDLHNNEIFDICIKESTKNALTMYEMHQAAKDKGHGENFKLFNCVHGINLKDMLNWHAETTNNHEIEYDGFSLATSTDMKYLIALRLGFAMEYSKGKPFHLLGVSSPLALTLITYANKYTDTQIYFDSSSASTGRMIRKYMTMWDFSSNGIPLLESDARHAIEGTFHCPCPICSKLEKPSDLWANGTTSGILITLHNLFWMTTYTNYLRALVNYEEIYEAYARRLTNEPADSPHGRTSWSDLDGNVLSQAEIEICEAKGEKLTKNPINCSWVLNYMGFVDCVNAEGLEVAYAKYIESVESSDDWMHGTENKAQIKDIEAINSETNSKTPIATRIGLEAGKTAVLQQLKGNEVLAEIVDTAATVTTESTNVISTKKGRKVAPKVEARQVDAEVACTVNDCSHLQQVVMQTFEEWA